MGGDIMMNLESDIIGYAVMLNVKLMDCPEFTDLITQYRNTAARICAYPKTLGTERFCDARLCDLAIAYQYHGKKEIMQNVMGAGNKAVCIIETALNKALDRLWNERNRNIETGAKL